MQDKINHFWVVAKKELEDRKSKLRNLDREIQDLEEKESVEIKVRRCAACRSLCALHLHVLCADLQATREALVI